MTKRLRTLALAAALALPAAARAAAMPASGNITGLWLVENGSAVIDIVPCGGAVCGRIVGYEIDNPANPDPLDWMGRDQCDLTLLNAAPTADGSAYNGWIIDPRNGRNYGVRLSVDPDGTLALHGYVLVPLLGATQHWTRYTGTVPKDCRIAGQGGKIGG